MGSIQYLRDLISDRLTAAAEEIFTEFEKTIVQYEEEIDRQRRLLDVVWKPHIPLNALELPQLYGYENEETLIDQQPSNYESNSMVEDEDPEPPQIEDKQEELCTSMTQTSPELSQIKTEQEKLCIIEDEEQLGMEQNSFTFVVTSDYEESDDNELQPNSDQLLFHIPSVAESPNQEASKHVDSGSTRCAKLKPTKKHHRNKSHSNEVDNTLVSGRHCDNGKANKSQTCEICGKGFRCKSDLQKHHRSHTGEKPYSCNTCGKTFSNISILNRHMVIHTGEKPFSCDICGKRFFRRFHLTTHMRMHTGEKPYSCDTCGKRFSNISVFNRHVVIHTGEKPNICETCGKSFSQRVYLTTHMRSHTGEKPYPCDTCGKRFSDMSAFHRHVVIHTGEKPFPCEICGKRFFRRFDLTTHMRTHTGEKPYLCKICGERFRRNSQLKIHMKIHTE